MKQIYVASYYRNGYSRFMKYIHNVFDHPQPESIEKRLEIIQFFGEFGAKATSKACTKGRSPIHKRKRRVHSFIEHFIIEYRTNHPGADKTTIAPALIMACTLAGVKPLLESTVGRIISDLKARGSIPRYGYRLYLYWH